jgi:hypothetical protein
MATANLVRLIAYVMLLTFRLVASNAQPTPQASTVISSFYDYTRSHRRQQR